MPDPAKIVYVLTSSPTQFGSGETAPERVEEVHADAWTAVETARDRLGHDRVIPDQISDAGHDAGVIWSGKSGSHRMTVTRMEIVPPSDLPGAS